MLDGEEYFTCVCGSFDHTLRFVLDLDRSAKEEHQIPTIYTEIQLNHYLPWYKRIIPGIKYIFGQDVHNPYNCWEINAESDDPDRMIEMIQKLKAENELIRERREKKYEDSKK